MIRSMQGQSLPISGIVGRGPLLISSIIASAARESGGGEVASWEADGGGFRRMTYAELEMRARRSVHALRGIGVLPGDRVATLATSSHRLLELCYAVPGMGAIHHLIEPQLGLEDIALTMNDDAGDCALFTDPEYAQLVPGLVARVPSLRSVVVLCRSDQVPELGLPSHVSLRSYEELLASATTAAPWPRLDEITAGTLHYIRDADGQREGLLQSHRTTLLQVLAVGMRDAYGLYTTDRVLVTSPTRAADGWLPLYCATAAGASLVLPGNQIDGASLVRTMQDEQVTCAAGAPEVWLGVLEELRRSGARLTSLRRVHVGGSSIPHDLAEALGEHGVEVRLGSGVASLFTPSG